MLDLLFYSKEKEGVFMFKHDGEEALVGLVIGLCIIGVVIYLMVILATIIAGVAAAGGTLFGGGSAIKNYVLSFKENVIDSNKPSVIAA